MAVGKVSDADFEAEVLKATGPVVVDFWAEWCGPCRMIAPALDELSTELGDKVIIAKLNIDENPQPFPPSMACSRHSHHDDLPGRPGRPATKVGAAPKQKLQQWITAAV